MAHIGIFGPTLCGKTTLAKHLSKEYSKRGYQTLALLQFPDNWGAHAWVTMDPVAFDKKLSRSWACMVFVEEAADTIARDRDKMGWFTRIRHRCHLLHVIGHSGTDLLPGMRRQLTTLYLFRQDEESADTWARQFTDKRILECATLEQYEFLECRMFKAPRRTRLKL